MATQLSQIEIDQLINELKESDEFKQLSQSFSMSFDVRQDPDQIDVDVDVDVDLDLDLFASSRYGNDIQFPIIRQGVHQFQSTSTLYQLYLIDVIRRVLKMLEFQELEMDQLPVNETFVKTKIANRQSRQFSQTDKRTFEEFSMFTVNFNDTRDKIEISYMLNLSMPSVERVVEDQNLKYEFSISSPESALTDICYYVSGRDESQLVVDIDPSDDELRSVCGILKEFRDYVLHKIIL